MTPLQVLTSMAVERYLIYDDTLDTVRNRQEARVATAMRVLLPTALDFCGCRLCVEDVFALSLNALPPHYVQSGSLMMRSASSTDEDIERAVADALAKAHGKPNHPA